MIASAQPIIDRRAGIDALRLARRILSEHRYRAIRAPAHRSVWEAIWQWLVDRWHQLIDPLGAHVHIGRGVSMAIGDLVLLVAIALVIWVAIRVIGHGVRSAAAHNAQHPLQRSAGPDELYESSLQAAGAGQYRQAIALIFRAALLRLVERRVLRDERGQTVNQCRRAVNARAPRSAAAFDAMAEPFTAAVYAEAPVTERQWQYALDAYARLAVT